VLRAFALCALALALSAGTAKAVGEPQVIEDERGDAALVFNVLAQDRPLQATSAPAGGTFEPLTPLTPADNGYYAVAGDEQGGAVAAWERTGPQGTYPNEAFVSVKPPGGRFGAPHRLSEPGKTVDEAQLDVNARGDAIVAWAEAPRDIVYSYRPTGGSFGPPETVPSPITHDLSVVLQADGGALFLGDSSPPPFGGPTRPWSVYLRPDGSFAPAVQLTDAPPSFGTSVAVAGNRRGDVLLAWGNHGKLFTKERPEGGVFGETRRTTTSPHTEGYFDPVRAVMNDARDAVVTFSDPYDPATRVVLRNGGGSFGSPRTLTSRTVAAALAINEHGDAALAWVSGARTVRAVYRRAGGALGAAMTVGTAGGAGSRPPSVAIDGAGTAMAVWEEGDGESVFVRSRSFARVPSGTKGTVVTLPAYTQEAPPEACVPDGFSVVAKSARAVVAGAARNFVGCLLARGITVDLSRTWPYMVGEFSEVQAPARVAVAGPYAASVVLTYFHGGSTGTAVSIVDLRDPLSGLSRVAGGINTGDTAQVPALRLRRDGAAAWIACPPAKKRARGTCWRGSQRIKQVYAFGLSRSSPKLVGQGAKIDPASLKIGITRVRWRDGKHRRSAPLG
jgi:hypothetical protein